jgi:hypothetical protein
VFIASLIINIIKTITRRGRRSLRQGWEAGGVYRCILTAVLGICCRRNLKLFCHYAYAIWLPDLGNMLLVGFASYEQAAG